MLKVAAFTGGRMVPSARFRVRQYIPALQKQNIKLHEFYSQFGQYPPREKFLRPFWAMATLFERLPAVAMSYRYDAVLFQREMMSSFVTLEPFTKRPRILDVDDAIFLQRGGTFARRLAELSDKVICGNAYLAEHFIRWNKNTDIVPTAVDSEHYFPRSQPISAEKPIVVGWIGTSGNYTYLYRTEKALKSFFQQWPTARLRIVSDSPPVFRHLQPEQVDFVSWSEQIEVQQIQAMDIGIMPLEDTLWARGKCAFKMLQYMACGIPVVVSPVGMNAEVLKMGEIGFGARTDDEWTDALINLASNREAREFMGSIGREVILSRFCTERVASSFAASILDVVN